MKAEMSAAEVAAAEVAAAEARAAWVAEATKKEAREVAELQEAHDAIKRDQTQTFDELKEIVLLEKDQEIELRAKWHMQTTAKKYEQFVAEEALREREKEAFEAEKAAEVAVAGTESNVARVSEVRAQAQAEVERAKSVVVETDAAVLRAEEEEKIGLSMLMEKYNVAKQRYEALYEEEEELTKKLEVAAATLREREKEAFEVVNGKRDAVRLAKEVASESPSPFDINAAPSSPSKSVSKESSRREKEKKKEKEEEQLKALTKKKEELWLAQIERYSEWNERKWELRALGEKWNEAKAALKSFDEELGTLMKERDEREREEAVATGTKATAEATAKWDAVKKRVSELEAARNKKEKETVDVAMDKMLEANRVEVAARDKFDAALQAFQAAEDAEIEAQHNLKRGEGDEEE